MHVRTHTRVHVQKYMYVYIYVHTYILYTVQVHIHTYIRTYIHMHIVSILNDRQIYTYVNFSTCTQSYKIMASLTSAAEAGFGTSLNKCFTHAMVAHDDQAHVT